jgi:uncharacterized protein
MKSEILTRALSGERFDDLDIIDSHCHMGPWYNFYFPEGGIESMLHDAGIMGIKTMCIAPHASISCDYKLGNKQILAVTESYPQATRALLVLNPNMPDEIKDEFDRYYYKEQFIGVKLHPSLHNYSLTSKNCMEVYDRVKEIGGYILAHTWDGSLTCSVEMCEEIIAKYPQVPFILAHSGGTRAGVEKTINLVNSYENAYMDTSGFEFSNTWIEDIIEKADNTKVLFGSDCPFHDIRGGTSRILLADFADEVKKAVLGGNFRKMLLKNKKL